MPSPASSLPVQSRPAVWPAPRRESALDARVSIPGSKSLTNRFLVLAALADEPSRLRSPLHSRDTELMAAALSALGATVTKTTASGDFGSDWLVQPLPRVGAPGPLQVDCGLAGTVMRFIPPVAALCSQSVVLDGDAGARIRPMRTTIDALRALGVQIDDGGRGLLPFTVNATGQVRGGNLTIDASASSQFVSGLLLAGGRFDLGLDLRHAGPVLPGRAHIRMTIEVLRDAGLLVDDSEPDRWQIEPGVPRGLDVTVEPDLSNAAPFAAAALVSGGSVQIRDWPTWTTQAGDSMRWLIDAFGGSSSLDRSGLTVHGTGELSGVDVDLGEVGELTPVVAAVAALADGPSRIRGVAHLRGHETDRLKALTTEINRLGGSAEETADGLLIRPAKLHGGVVETYHDHRMAMAAAVIGLRVPGVGIENVDTTAKTLPEFTQLWTSLVDSAGRNRES
ncbi:3-phosphoshikimate 1-carboxyvinyltransferase [Saxibacter everestensis]|uniref:3-phosphoshikimate 1-carboxyvinyltransferase n=1 Tax=Saxibacter everestensis TaxID=2909229 RepID=A0ABY8QNH3_9MICO|nr:3-phosphoshikimate 1-carboxyvinyltransferase [Brevibacteriaceae bacterium ZFBP1038]